jgi:hypothetical protein
MVKKPLSTAIPWGNGDNTMADQFKTAEKGNATVSFNSFTLESGQKQYEVSLWGNGADVTVFCKDKEQALALNAMLVESEDIDFKLDRKPSI